MDHVISADESETIEIQRKTMDWTGKLAKLFGRANTDGIHQASQGLGPNTMENLTQANC
jgi:hypothetical protein